ncbi:MAG: CBS domain-containing protein [Phycisphaerae bacterium]|nr:CBS domain-containing protein [Phycisphaerae bacterium]
MQCGVVSVQQDESVYAAISILVEKHLSGLPVVDCGRLVGIISEKDVLCLLRDFKHLTGHVTEYMTKKVVSYDIEDTLEDVGLALINNTFRRVAILREGKLCGVMSRSDLIRYYVETLKVPSLQEDGESRKRSLQAKDVMKCGLLTVEKQTSLYEAADILSSRRVTGLPVVDHGMYLQGIVSEKDILRTLFDPYATTCRVHDIMTEEVISFGHTDSIFDICDCLIHNDFRRVPILNDGRLVGIVSRADIMMFILKHRSEISKGMA